MAINLPSRPSSKTLKAITHFMHSFTTQIEEKTMALKDEMQEPLLSYSIRSILEQTQFLKEKNEKLVLDAYNVDLEDRKCLRKEIRRFSL